MERDRRSVISLFSGEEFAVGEVRLMGDAAHHARVRRVARGDAVHLLDGRGRVGIGAIRGLSKNDVSIAIERIMEVPKPVALEVILPIADRDRMLLAAEKCIELQITAWRPAYFARSRSVAPRGEGTKFREKVTARMHSALEQCGGAWLPEIHDDAEAKGVMDAVPAAFQRLLLEQSGSGITSRPLNAACAVAVGPEGGLEPTEIAAALDQGWTPVSLGVTTLRFETAAIAAVAVIRATQLSTRSS